ncbi:GDYXXLXY domain-containing protein [Candidatus Woesearchaeota archaeon]|nr:GDYXXLXY domain-containing protein [Candidatus Woesearchaeota archaeon]
MNKQYARVIIALTILMGGALAFALYLYWPLLTGQTIVLALRPVDPFDIFRGQYMTLNYEISTIPALEGVEQGDKIYVALEPDENGIWRYRESSLARPEQGIFIRGTVKSVYSSMRVEYGIEQFFFERGASLPRMNITVEAKVDSFGRARISNLLHNGKPVEVGYQNISLTS